MLRRHILYRVNNDNEKSGRIFGQALYYQVWRTSKIWQQLLGGGIRDTRELPIAGSPTPSLKWLFWRTIKYSSRSYIQWRHRPSWCRVAWNSLSDTLKVSLIASNEQPSRVTRRGSPVVSSWVDTPRVPLITAKDGIYSHYLSLAGFWVSEKAQILHLTKSYRDISVWDRRKPGCRIWNAEPSPSSSSHWVHIIEDNTPIFSIR